MALKSRIESIADEVEGLMYAEQFASNTPIEGDHDCGECDDCDGDCDHGHESGQVSLDPHAVSPGGPEDARLDDDDDGSDEEAVRPMFTKGQIAEMRLRLGPRRREVIETVGLIGSIADARWVEHAKPAQLVKALVAALEKVHSAGADNPTDAAYSLDVALACASKLGIGGQPWDSLYSAGEDLIRAYQTMHAVDKKIIPHIPAALAAAKKLQSQTK